MNRPEHPGQLIPIPDTQSARDERHLAIDQVGIRGLRYPLVFCAADGVAQPTIATANVYVALPEDRKGTHMSRLVTLLEERAAAAVPLSVAGLDALLRELVVRLDAPAGRIEFAFPFFVRKSAPVSGVASLLDYEVRLAGELAHGRVIKTVTVAVPVTSLCPCSKEVAEYGAHNQRSTVTITVRAEGTVDVHELLRIAEDEASSELYGVLKRVDEKYVTERAYDNPRFVEDLVRAVATRLGTEPRFAAWCVEAENFESIHNHSAYARIARGM
ncbi:MAG: GTP cyclohydrolase I FolE2 [Burkholderiales bacterium]|nr:GTP cyclohydrolase I FolE2 [Burkholderiales bacterium]